MQSIGEISISGAEGGISGILATLRTDQRQPQEPRRSARRGGGSDCRGRAFRIDATLKQTAMGYEYPRLEAVPFAVQRPSARTP